MPVPNKEKTVAEIIAAVTIYKTIENVFKICYNNEKKITRIDNMKVILPHKFLLYAANYSLKSMLASIAYWSNELFQHEDPQFGHFASSRKYKIPTDNGMHFGKVTIVQPWLLDLAYDLIVNNLDGHKNITKNETLHLIALHNDYANDKSAKRLSGNKVSPMLNVYGMLGEQIRFQRVAHANEEFSREKYILDILSVREDPENIYDINVPKEFLEITGFTTDQHACLLFSVFAYFTQLSFIIDTDSLPKDLIIDSSNEIINSANFKKIIQKYSVTLNEARNSPLKRQVFYSKPIVKLDEKTYVAINPILLMFLFANSEYWVMRNHYMQYKSQHFINAFGTFFEMYVKEVLQKCIDSSLYSRIEENNGKRADWLLKIANKTIFIEQKSGLSMLSIKQTHPNTDAMLKHMESTWKEAVDQLISTEKAYNFSDTIKIILVYEEYFKSETLNEWFKRHPEYNNDGSFWLVNINEFETLLQTYKDNPSLAEKIFEEKYNCEKTFSGEGRDLQQIFSRHGINSNPYLIESRIHESQFERIVSLCS